MQKLISKLNDQGYPDLAQQLLEAVNLYHGGYLHKEQLYERIRKIKKERVLRWAPGKTSDYERGFQRGYA